jgi:hypothetical protein
MNRARKEHVTMNQMKEPRRAAFIKAIPLVLVAIVLFMPFVGAAADPAPATSSSASAPPTSPLSAAIFAGTSPAPSAEAWKTAAIVTGVRIGGEARRHECYVKHVADWVRIECNNLGAGRADLLAGEKRDLTLFKGSVRSFDGEDIVAQFSMRPGDRRVIQWTSQDFWWWTWNGDEGLMASGIQSIGPMYGLVAQIDWASGPEPIISLH